MSFVGKKQKGLTRRDFVKGATAGAVGGLVVGTVETALSATKRWSGFLGQETGIYKW